ncbi:MAG TPA: DUF4126 domain-containing protein [Tepidisphaeraceae bacterium]|nr:DUF4126 domain-containing protein [Tepidisphaeraceae bacterium]
MYDVALAVCAGVSLAAACGFRVFVPLLGLSVATAAGVVSPAKGWEWVGTAPAIVALAVATVLELAAYYIPWVDHLLDTIATPTAIGAGTVAAGLVLPVDEPWLRWVAAAITGGGAAGAVQTGTVLARGISGGTTGGLGNWLVATAENAASIVLSILAIVVPIIAAILVIGILAYVVRNGKRVVQFFRRRAAPTPDVA